MKHLLAYPFLERCPFPDDTELGHVLGYLAGLVSARALLLDADPDFCSQGKAKQRKTKQKPVEKQMQAGTLVRSRV